MTSEDDLLRTTCYNALGRIRESHKLYADYDVYDKRLLYELAVYEKQSYSPLILIIADYINWARANGVVTGPGRGSAAGSLVVYLAGITTIDPIRFGLIFERFLNPSRISLPDIDSDFSDRDKVIEYLRGKYGQNRVVHVGVPSLFKPRSAIDEFAKVLDIPWEEAKSINKLVTEDTFEESLAANPTLKTYMDKYPKLFDLAHRVLGNVHHITTHPSAVILSNGPAGTEIPLCRSRDSAGDGTLITQWDGEELDLLGHVKLDILTVDNLSVINETVQSLDAAIRSSIDIYDMPIDDAPTLREFELGHTIGIFQLEEQKTVAILQGLKGITFDDVCAVNALIRPGLDVGQFIQAHNDPSKVTYLLPELKPILESTYGVILYQEQVMRICVELANFTMSEADTVRKIIAKTANQRAVDGLNPVYDKFKAGYLSNNLPADKFEALWAKILACQKYIFNRSHCYCYGYIAYVDMYLKTHYPLEFMCALLRNNSKELFVKECNRLGIKVLQPCVSKSASNYAVVPGERSIRMGLSNVKSVGNGNNIIKKRPYKDLTDFINRSTVKSNATKPLAEAGALDCFGSRIDILRHITGGNYSTFHLANGEKENIGFYLTVSPLGKYNEHFAQCVTMNGSKPQSGIIGGMIMKIHRHEARTGTMAFLKLLVTDGELEALVWPSVFENYRDTLDVGKIIMANGRRTDRGGYALDNIQVLP